jgi:hypothetical protein
MKRMTRLLAIALGVFAISFASAAAADTQERPFHAEVVGFPNITPTPVPCIFENHPTAEGTATHLGTASFSAEEVINACDPQRPPQITSSFVIVGANGDEIHGSIDVELFTNPDGSAAAVGPYTLTGGTGRFEGASGGGTWTVTFASFTSPAFVTADGTIVY